jgi:ribose 5-phosphate isomerase B
MRLIVGADVTGFALKEEIKAELGRHGCEVTDVGMFNNADQIPYYEVAADAARRIQRGEADRALLFCGTGMGVAIVANKFKGVYAAVVESEFTGEHCKVINNANVLAMGGLVVTPYRAKRIVSLWLQSSFTQGYEPIADFLKDACEKVKAIESENMK